MRYTLNEILNLAKEGNFAVPAFNVYNLETLIGVTNAAEESNAPIIVQMYSRLFDTDTGKYMAPTIRDVMDRAKTPIAFHLDHGAGETEVIRAIRYGATGVMLDVSTKPFEENIEKTKNVVEIATAAGIDVEGEIGHIGSTSDEKCSDYTDVCEAAMYAEKTGIKAMAIMVGTAHGHYKKAPKLDIDRIAEIHAKTNVHLVLHGGSGVPDDQIRAAVAVGIRKINFGTDVCYAFTEGYKKVEQESLPLDVKMTYPTKDVKSYALEKIRLLGADKYHL